MSDKELVEFWKKQFKSLEIKHKELALKLEAIKKIISDN
jgi:hypothetical protein